jgi:pimeloyl-ACP methyl ester carboxylesterase
MSALSIIIQIVVVIIIIILLLIVWLISSCDRILMFPTTEEKWQVDIPYKRINMGGLNVVYFSNFPSRKTILMCNGNYGNLTMYRHMIKLCDKFRLNLIMWDYSGFGRSLGTHSIGLLKGDSDKIYKYASNNVKPSDLIVWGLSLGGNPAVYIASKYPCHCLVMMSTFTNINDVMFDTTIGFDSYKFAEESPLPGSDTLNTDTKKNLPPATGESRYETPRIYDINESLLDLYNGNDSICGRVVKGLGSMISPIIKSLDSMSLIKRVKTKVVVIHSLHDDVICYRQGVELYRLCPSVEKLFIGISGTHVNPTLSNEQENQLVDFICSPNIVSID